MAPEGDQQRRNVGERGGQQQEECGLGAEPRAVAALDRVREEVVERHQHPTPWSEPRGGDQVWLLLAAIAAVSTATGGAGKRTNGKDAEALGGAELTRGALVA